MAPPIIFRFVRTKNAHFPRAVFPITRSQHLFRNPCHIGNPKAVPLSQSPNIRPLLVGSATVSVQGPALLFHVGADVTSSTPLSWLLWLVVQPPFVLFVLSGWGLSADRPSAKLLQDLALCPMTNRLHLQRATGAWCF